MNWIGVFLSTWLKRLCWVTVIVYGKSSTHRMAAVEKQLDENDVAPATTVVPQRRLEEVQCAEPDGPQLFVDGVCSCMEDLLIANRSVLERLHQMNETVTQLTSMGSGDSSAASFDMSWSSSAFDPSSQNVDFTTISYPDPLTNNLTPVTDLTYSTCSVYGSGWQFVNRNSVTAAEGFAAQSMFINVSNVNCTGNYACWRSQFFNVSTITCDGDNACNDMMAYGVDTLIVSGGAAASGVVIGVRSMRCSDQNSCKSLYVYGLPNGTTANPATFIDCESSACCGAYFYNAAVNLSCDSGSPSVYCGTATNTGTSSVNEYSGDSYCFD